MAEGYMAERRVVRRRRTALQTGAVGAALVVGTFGMVGPSGAATKSGLTLKSSVTIGGAYEIPGESAVGAPTFDDGVRLAIATLNKHGGIGGKSVQYVREPMSVLTLGETPGQFLTLVQKNPSVIIGLPATSQYAVLQSEINTAKIPVLSISPTNQQALYAGPTSSKYLWFVPPAAEYSAQATVDFAVQTLKKKKVGIVGVNTAFGTGSVTAAVQGLAKLGVKPVAVKYHANDATTLTSTILAVKAAGANVLISFTYPNPLVVLVKEAAQNGLKVPIIAGGSSSTEDISRNLITGSELTNLYVTPGGCAPGAKGQSAALAAFTKAYEAKYGTVPTPLGAASYDAVFIYKAAVQKAKSSTPIKVNAALAGLKSSTVNGVVCGPYVGDGAHLFGHDSVAAQYLSNGGKKVLRVIKAPPLKKQS